LLKPSNPLKAVSIWVIFSFLIKSVIICNVKNSSFIKSTFYYSNYCFFSFYCSIKLSIIISYSSSWSLSIWSMNFMLIEFDTYFHWFYCFLLKYYLNLFIFLLLLFIWLLSYHIDTIDCLLYYLNYVNLIFKSWIHNYLTEFFFLHLSLYLYITNSSLIRKPMKKQSSKLWKMFLCHLLHFQLLHCPPFFL
jgi:hypothetical protein